MNNNLPQKYSKNFFSNFIRKIKMFFINKNKEIEPPSNTHAIDDNQINKNDLLDRVKVDANFIDDNTELEKRKFMEHLSDHPNLLEEFSIERLEKILQIYLNENRKKIDMLNAIEKHS